MEPKNKGTQFDAECQVATEDKNKAYKKIQQGYGTRSLIEEYNEKRGKDKTIHKRKKKEWMNMELENMQLLRKQHEFRTYYEEINMARKQFKLRVNMFRNENGSLISNRQEIIDRWVRYFDKLLNGNKYNECVTFTSKRSNQISKGKTQDTTDAPLLGKLKQYWRI